MLQGFPANPTAFQIKKAAYWLADLLNGKQDSRLSKRSAAYPYPHDRMPLTDWNGKEVDYMSRATIMQLR